MLYFCTAGRGTEIFVGNELQQKLKIPSDQIEKTDGKVFFHFNSSDINKICQLKAVERVFAQVLHVKTRENTVNLKTYNDIKQAVLTCKEWSNPELLTVIDTLKNGGTETAEIYLQPPPTKKHCGSPQHTSFRVSCKCTGRVGKHVQSQNLSRQIGVSLSKHLNWTIDLKHPSIEVNIHLNDDGLIVGIPLKKSPLSKRSYIKHFGLRATVSWIMADIVNTKCADIVLDPMCGKATILLELAKINPTVQCLGVDKDEKQLKLAEDNIRFSKLTPNIQLIQADFTVTLLQDNSVDGVVCDAPFGKKFELDQAIMVFYSKLFKQVNRILRPGGRFVLLTSSDIYKSILKLNGAKFQKHVTDTENEHTDKSTYSLNELESVELYSQNKYSCDNKQKTLLSNVVEHGEITGHGYDISSLSENQPTCLMTEDSVSALTAEHSADLVEQRQNDDNQVYGHKHLLVNDRTYFESSLNAKTGGDIKMVGHYNTENLEIKHKVNDVDESPDGACEKSKYVKNIFETDYRYKDHDCDKTQLEDHVNKTSKLETDYNQKENDACSSKNETEVDCAGLLFINSYYIKLGETDSYICVFIK